MIKNKLFCAFIFAWLWKAVSLNPQVWSANVYFLPVCLCLVKLWCLQNITAAAPAGARSPHQLLKDPCNKETKRNKKAE